MNLQGMYDTQRALDYQIFKEKGITGSKTEEKIIAFKVEVGEFANEERTAFKYWSHKPPSDADTLIEELVDTIHFLLSIINDRGADGRLRNIRAGQFDQWETKHLLIAVFNNPLDCEGNLYRAFSMMLAVGHKLGFSEEDIRKAYYKKVEINQRRAVSKY